ncbi:MAG: hypothetical protein N3C58_07835 [Meiothermus ruber]|nr:hypothetical protein [Meiothermus ruber]
MIEREYPQVAGHLRQLGMEGSPIRAQGTANCSGGGSITYTDNPADNDRDGIFASAEFRYNNCKNNEGLTINGSIKIRDKNDGDPGSGYTVVGDLTFTAGTNQARVVLGIDLTPGSGGAYQVRYGFLTEQGSNKIAYGLNLSYTPSSDGNSNPYDAGVTNFDGRIVYRVSGENFVLSMKGENLQHNRASCTSSFVAGKATFQDSASNRLVIQYDGCRSYTVTYNGNPI